MYYLPNSHHINHTNTTRHIAVHQHITQHIQQTHTISAKNGARRLPTRFTVAASDTLLTITRALAVYSCEKIRKEEKEKEQKEKERERVNEAKEREGLDSVEDLIIAAEPTQKKPTAKKKGLLIEEIAGGEAPKERAATGKKSLITVVGEEQDESPIVLLWKQLDVILALVVELAEVRTILLLLHLLSNT